MNYFYYFTKIYLLRKAISRLIIIFLCLKIFDFVFANLGTFGVERNEAWQNYSVRAQDLEALHSEPSVWDIDEKSCIYQSNNTEYFYKDNEKELNKDSKEAFKQKLNICIEPNGYSSYFNPSMNLLWRVCDDNECYFGSSLLQGDGSCKVIYGYPEDGKIPSKKICAKIEYNQSFEDDISSGKKTFNTHKFCAYKSNSDLQHTEMQLFKSWNSLDMNNASQYFNILHSADGDLSKLWSQFNSIYFPLNNNVFLYNHENQISQNIFLNLVLLAKFRDFRVNNLTYFYANQLLECVEISNSPSLINPMSDYTLYKVCSHNPFTDELEKSTLDNPCEKIFQEKGQDHFEHVEHDGVKNYLRIINSSVIPSCIEDFETDCSLQSTILNSSGYFQCLFNPNSLTHNLKEGNIISNFFILDNISLWDIKSNKLKVNCVQQRISQNKARIMYTLKINLGTQKQYQYINKYHLDEIGIENQALRECSDIESISTEDFVCQEPWGVDIGFNSDNDLEVFLYGENPISKKNYKTALKNQNKEEKEESVSLVTSPYQFANGIQYPNQICLIKETGSSNGKRAELLGCEQRSYLKKFKVEPSKEFFTETEAKQNYYNPQIKVIFQSESMKNERSEAIFGTQTFSSRLNLGSVNLEGVVSLFGKRYQVIVTSKNPLEGKNDYLWLPFDSKAIHDEQKFPEADLVISKSKNTIRGIYLNEEGKIDLNLNPLTHSNSTIYYLKGLEYVHGKYFRGGEKICLKPLEEEYQCGLHSSNCSNNPKGQIINQNPLERGLCVDIPQLKCEWKDEKVNTFTVFLEQFLQGENDMTEVIIHKEEYNLEKIVKNPQIEKTQVGEQLFPNATYKLTHVSTGESKMLSESDMHNYEETCQGRGEIVDISLSDENKITINSLPGGKQTAHPVHFAQFACDIYEKKDEGIYWCLLDEVK